MIELKFADKYKEGVAYGESIGEARGEARGKAIGEARGKAMGESIGEARGKANGRADIVNTLLQQNSIAQVAAMLGKTEEEIKEIIKM